jgi:DNA-binding transcriptional ArsR family regulator
MNDALQPDHCARLLRALGAPERLRIVQVLREGPRNVSELAEQLDLKMVNLSHHLTVLRHAGIVRDDKQGRFVVYSLNPAFFHPDGADRQHLDLGCCRLELPPPEG